MKKNDEIILEIEDLSADGAALENVTAWLFL